jgi:hypothetical protein
VNTAASIGASRVASSTCSGPNGCSGSQKYSSSMNSRLSASKTRMVMSNAAPIRSRNALTPGVAGSPRRYTPTMSLAACSSDPS